MTTLGLDPDELSTCVACGLCLPHCPTWRVTGEEALSPRGRIATMRAVEDGLPIDADVLRSVDTCVQCRGCEPACPAGVPFGHLMEDTRAALVERGKGRVPSWQRLGYRMLGHHRLLLVLSSVGAVLQRLRLVPWRRLGLPERLPLRQTVLRASGNDVVLFTGCVMDAWMRPTHAAAQRLIEATGAGVALPGSAAACCGALHLHAGLVEQARELARRTMSALPGDAPVLVDAAGCGAALKDYGRLLGTADAVRFSERVLDVHEWLAARIDDLPPPQRLAGVVAIQDPCHLRHVQRAHEPVRALLRRYAEVVELDDEGLCCGAGGAYSLTQPELARDIRDRKLAAIARSGAAVVASANPGCALHLAAAGVRVRHPVEIIEEALNDGR